MKKRFLIAIIPALLALSACQGGAQEKVDKNLFLEDTLAHEEIFGDINFSDIMPKASKLGQPGIRKLGDDPVTHPDLDPAIGVQSKVEDGKVSFRFVAAVAFPDGKLAPTNAQWTRTVSKVDGSDYPKDTGNVECTTAYTSLSSDGDPYTIDQFNLAQEPDTEYTHFVVYTLRNIPVSSYSGYYVCAYLTLSGEGGLNQKSKALAISVDETKKYAFDADQGKYFMMGSLGEIEANSYGGGNIASFTGLNFAANDAFLIWGFDNTKLKVFDFDDIGGEVSSYNFKNSTGAVGVKYKGAYNVYLTNEYKIYANATNVARPLYIRLDYVKNDFWFNASAVTRVYAYKDGVRADWFDVNLVESQKYYVTDGDIDPALYDYVIIARMNPDDLTGGWWNQTIGIRLDISDDDNNSLKVPNCVAVWTSTQWQDDKNKQEYGWEHYTPAA